MSEARLQKAMNAIHLKRVIGQLLNSYNLEIMNKRKIFMIVVAAAVVAMFATSCSDEFYEGFGEGWNMTAPEHLRY